MEIKSTYQLMAPFRSQQTEVKSTELWAIAMEQIAREFPIATNFCKAVNYDTKTDKYVGSFAMADDEVCKIKVTVPVAKFLLANLRIRSTDGRMVVAQAYLRLDDDGACDDVLLVTI
jgi:hypothetical protein